MFLFIHLPTVNIDFLNSITYKRALLTHALEMNSNTERLQKLLVKNTKLVNSSDNKNFINQAIKKILERYWMEYIYITPFDMTSNKLEDIILRYYVSQNTRLGANNVQIDLKKYLSREQIKFLYSNNNDLWNNKLSIKYPSLKSLKQLYNNLKNFYKISLDKQVFNKSKNQILELLKKQKFPVFMITNGTGEVVVGEPQHTLSLQKKIFSQIGETKKISINNYLPLREAYIFINPLDAKEYCNYLQYKYSYSSNELKLKVFTSTLQEFYKKNRLMTKDIQFRLLPDLKEVGKLVTNYRHHPNIYFNIQQKYGKNYFQGQPIYIIKPTLCTYKNPRTRKISKRYFPNLLTLGQKDYYNIFTNYEDILSIWVKYRRRFHEYKLPYRPKLTVYNLESLLQNTDISNATAENLNLKTRFVPSYEVYQYVNKIQRPQITKLLKNINMPTQFMLLMKVWTNRILWGMVKWYPPRQIQSKIT